MTEDSNKEYFAEIFNKHSSTVYRTAYFITKSSILADDITQETFIQIIRKFHMYDSSKPLEPWIYKITVNITRNMIRKQKLLSLVGMPTNIVQEDLVEPTILRNESNAELWKEIIKLPRKSKEVVILHFYSEFTLSEVAGILSIPLGTCKSRLNYALNKLRENKSTIDELIQNELEGR